MYLLDTNICIYIINKRPIQVVEHIKTLEPKQIHLSSISLAELEYGVSKSCKKAVSKFEHQAVNALSEDEQQQLQQLIEKMKG